MQKNFLSRLENSNKYLIGVLRKTNTIDVLRFCAFEILNLHLNQRRSSKLSSPHKQIFHLLGLLLTVSPENTTNLNSKKIEKIKEHLEKVFEQYGYMFFPVSQEEASSEEWRKVREVAMPVFLDYFNNCPLLYKEQIISRIKIWFAPFSKTIEDKTGISIEKALKIVLWITDELQNLYDSCIDITRTLKEEIDKYHSQGQLLGVEETAKQEPFKSILYNFKNITKRLNIIRIKDLEKNFGKEDTKYFLSLLSVERPLSTKYFYPTERNPAEFSPIFKINDDIFCPSTYQLLIALMKHFEEILRNSTKRTAFFNHRDGILVEQTELALKNFFHPKHKIWKSVYETPTAHKEHDLLVQVDNKYLILEVKATQPKEPFRDPDRAYTRIKRDFHSDTGIQKAYDQANSLRKLLLTNKIITLYDRKGNEITQINGPVEEAFCICVTSDSFGILTTNLSLLLDKDTSEPFPWAISLPDLENILSGFKYKKKNIDDFLFYLRQRANLHGTVFTCDELEIAGTYLRYGNFDWYFNQLSTSKNAKIILSSEMADIFDEIYYKEKGFAYPNPKLVANTPIITDVKMKLQSLIDEENRLILQEKQQRKIGRNEPCPCKSGKKYKKCHGY